MTYQEQLKHPNWQRKRLEILHRDNFTCTNCGSKEKQLHVHHGAYISGYKIWDYHEWSLHTLCNTCHSVISEDINSYSYALSIMRQNHENYKILKEFVEKISLINNDDKFKLSEYIKSIPY
jgi:hypothetical protein